MRCFSIMLSSCHEWTRVVVIRFEIFNEKMVDILKIIANDMLQWVSISTLGISLAFWVTIARDLWRDTNMITSYVYMTLYNPLTKYWGGGGNFAETITQTVLAMYDIIAIQSYGQPWSWKYSCHEAISSRVWQRKRWRSSLQAPHSHDCLGKYRRRQCLLVSGRIRDNNHYFDK